MGVGLNFHATEIEGCYLIEAGKATDDRGWFLRLFDEGAFKEIGFTEKIVQINQANNRKRGTLRGMHYQISPHAETKIVSCLSGKLWDVAVDLRKNSQTFLKWTSVELSSDQSKIFMIAKGCAHGYVTLEDDTTVLYFHSEVYSPQQERGINYLDPTLKIEWKGAIAIVSDRDKNLPFLEKDFEGISL
jgi:dTDP-4-dehydrorhamnose 3,5-epimerase